MHSGRAAATASGARAGVARTVRPYRRAWRRRSRRAQVAPVAVILSLLLLVMFIANYISTTLPNTMAQNDLQHEVQVEGQVARLSALLEATAQKGVLGAQVLQPVTLGSAAAPPFAPPDSGWISAGNHSQGMKVNYTALGPQIPSPPFGGKAGGTHVPQCTYASSSPQISCSGTPAYTLYYNFTGSAVGSSPYSIVLSGTYFVYLNLSVNSSTIALSSLGVMSVLVLNVFGSQDTVSVPLSNATENVVLLGSSDTLTLSGSATATTGHTNVVVVGNSDTVTSTATGNSHVFVSSFYGKSNVFQPGTVSGKNNTFEVFFTGLNTTAPGYGCPNDNVAGTNTVTQPTVTGTGDTFALTYNNTTGSISSGTIGKWTPVHNNIPGTTFACPFYSLTSIAVPGSVPATSAVFVVHLINTYEPSTEVALDQGTVVYAQPGGAPIFVAPPTLSYVGGVLSVFVPGFVNQIGSESGVGTVAISARLMSITEVTIPGNGFIFPTGSQVTVTIVSPYAAVWYAYFRAIPSLAPLVTCSGSNKVCSATALYAFGGPLGTVTLRFPVAGLTLELLNALYSVSLS